MLAAFCVLSKVPFRSTSALVHTEILIMHANALTLQSFCTQFLATITDVYCDKSASYFDQVEGPYLGGGQAGALLGLHSLDPS